MQTQTQPQVTYFNRHENMDNSTRTMILNTIKDLFDCPLGTSTFITQNWLFGAFDGHDYSAIAIGSPELASIAQVDVDLANRITNIFTCIAQYPRTSYANSNQF